MAIPTDKKKRINGLIRSSHWVLAIIILGLIIPLVGFIAFIVGWMRYFECGRLLKEYDAELSRKKTKDLESARTSYLVLGLFVPALLTVVSGVLLYSLIFQ